ncbi:MAG: CHASE2 domain-containing protein [bacterium]
MNDKNKIIESFKYTFIIITTLLMIIFLWSKSEQTLFNIETKLYDFRVGLTTDYSIFKHSYKKADKSIILVGIDDYAVTKLSTYKGIGTGRQPWARSTIADIISFINKGKPKAIILDLMFMGQEGDYPQNIKSDEQLARVLKKSKNTSIGMVLKAQCPYSADICEKAFLSKSQEKLLPIKNTLALKVTDSLSKANDLRNKITFFSFDPLFQPFIENTNHVGIVNLRTCADGITRYHIPVYRLMTKNGTIYLPSLAFSALLTVIPDEEKTKFKLTKDKIIIGHRSIPLNNEGKFLINWHGRFGSTYKNISIAKVVLSNAFNNKKISSIDKEDKISPDIFKDKIIVIGQTASGTDLHQTPMEVNHPGVEIVATCIDNILNDSYLPDSHRRGFTLNAPIWLNFIILAVFCLAIGVFNIKTKSNYLSIFWFFLLIITFIFFNFASFVYFKYWINIVYPLIFMFITAIATYVYKNQLIKNEIQEIEGLFGKFVSPQILNKLLKDPSLISKEGSRKHLTVLFSDVRGFTTLSETLPAHQLVAQLNELYNEVYEIILSHDGTLDKFIGDGVMAFYGDPLPIKNHALQAILSAKEIFKALEKLNKKWEQEGRQTLKLGIGISTGDMIAGHIGAKRMLSYTVMGDSVNLASRLEGLNKEYNTSIIISQSTYEEVKDQIDSVYLDEVLVKGKNKVVKIYSVL